MSVYDERKPLPRWSRAQTSGLCFLPSLQSVNAGPRIDKRECKSTIALLVVVRCVVLGFSLSRFVLRK